MSMETMQTGSAMKNQMPHEGAGRMFCRAMMFCGEAIGEAIPPRLQARAMPRMSALLKLESVGRLRRRGYNGMSEVRTNLEGRKRERVAYLNYREA